VVHHEHRSVTLKNVAERAGVSTTLVSYVINEKPVSIPQETRERVLRAIRELEYVPSATARGLRNRKTHLIAQVLLHYKPTDMLADPCLAGKASALVDYLTLQGYYHLTYPVPDGESFERDFIAFVKSHRVDGIVVENSLLDDPSIEPIAASRMPFVVYNNTPFQYPRSAVVNIDDEDGFRLSTMHLISQGHKRIGHLKGSPDSLADLVRMRTFEKVLKENGLEVHPEWIRGDGSCTVEDGIRSMGEILDLPERPTAIAATSDLLAMGALLQIRSRGLRVPEDMAIIGFDDIPAASMLTPPLSTIALSYRRLGELAGEQMMKLIQDPSLRLPPVSVPVRLVPRESTLMESGRS
jgi:LacI family transcriptional regulator